MVGRGGRSKACFLCRQRHLKCDETKPQCIRCKTSGLDCTGFPEVSPFIDEDPATRLQRRLQSKKKVVTRLPSLQLSLCHLGDDLYFAYLRRELRNGNKLLDGRWPGFSALEVPDDLSRQCITSFAASFFGRWKGNERAREDGLRLYTKSLRELNYRLSQPEDVSPAQTLLAICILTVCECLTATSNAGWMQHMLGLNAYFRLHRFKMFKERYVLWQFEEQRFWMIMAAIAARRPTCLASKEWLTMPWSYAQEEKSLRQYLLDHTSRIPSLYLIFIDYLKYTDPEARTARAVELETKMKALLHTLRTWEVQWNLEIPHVQEVLLSEEEKSQYGFATKLVFDNIDHTAFTFLMYNITMIILLELWKTFRRAQDRLSRNVLSEGNGIADIRLLDYCNGYHDTSLTTATLKHQSRKAALDICRTMLLFQTPDGSWLHAIQLLTAIRMALIVFRQDKDTPQVAWLEDVIREIAESQQGWDIGRYTMEEFGYP
ncbi:hypothetical protein H2200_006491 [Cladophialophora chaetospira]|uniref:Zn(2)-C6 fungal-type domain-containing protein n=1 Tax=Cladophialophora chaetospira TaxID=386627 RepID=A0AA38X8H3_9EURO|nr:hypothetical protein H2200_006491 [Cladophialophora chaetospira]